MFILFFSVVIVLLSIPIHLCEVLSIEIGSYLAQSSDFENLAENPTIPAETGVSWNVQEFLSVQELLNCPELVLSIKTTIRSQIKTYKLHLGTNTG